jgi:hypothetical protein
MSKVGCQEKKRKGGTGLTEERNVKLKGWVCCNGNASGEDLQIGYDTVRPFGGTGTYAGN